MGNLQAFFSKVTLKVFEIFCYAPQAKEDQVRAKLSPRPSLDSPLPLCMAQGEAFPLRIPFGGWVADVVRRTKRPPCQRGLARRKARLGDS